MKPLLIIISYCVYALLVWLLFRKLIRSEYLRTGKLSWYSVTLEILVFAIHANMTYLFLPATWPDIPSYPENPWQMAAGFSLLGVGVLITLGMMLYLGLPRSTGQGSAALQNKGIYGRTRNPQIVFYGMALTGIAVLWPSFYALIWLILYFYTGHMMILSEEEFLHKTHKKAYADYCRQVPRYISVSSFKQT